MPAMQAPTNRRLKISMLGLRAAFGAQGGIETHVRELAAGLMLDHASEIDVEIVERAAYVQRNRQLPEWTSGLRISSVWCPDQANLEAIVHTFLGVLRAAFARPDILHIHGIGPALMTPFARFLGLKVVVTHHGQDYAREKWGRFARWVLRTGELMAAKFANERIVISSSLESDLWKLYHAKFQYIPNPAPPIARRTATSTLEHYGLIPHKYIIHVGRFVPEKRQLDLVSAFLSCPPNDWSLVLVGASDHSDAYSRSILAAAEGQSRIVMAGVLGVEPIAELLSHTGLFALPSTHEGLPLALLEAMACGAPILVSNIPSLASLDLPKHCYVNPGKVEELSAALSAHMISLGASTALHRDWDEFLQPFKLREIAQKTMDVYRRATRGKVATRGKPVETHSAHLNQRVPMK